jgi:hypothetical protein
MGDMPDSDSQADRDAREFAALDAVASTGSDAQRDAAAGAIGATVIACPRCQAANPADTAQCVACGATLASERTSQPIGGRASSPRAPARPARQKAISTNLPCLSLLVLLASLVLLAFFFLLPSATITLVPDRLSVTVIVPIKAGPGVRVTDVEARQIPARQLTYEISGSDQLAITKRKDVLTGKAQGQVVFANRGDVPVVVPRGTIVSSASASGRYETAEEVLVPGAVFGTARVTVYALGQGPAGNTDKLTVSRIEGALGSLLYVANADALTGGEVRSVTYVTNEDRTRLHDMVLAGLKEQAYAKLRAQINESEFVPPESMSVVTIKEETYDKAVNEEAQYMRLTMRVTFAGTAIEGQKANDLATQVLNRQVKPGFQLQPQSVQLSPKEVQRVEGDTVSFIMQAQGTSIATLDEARIRRELTGKSQVEAQAYLDALPNQVERAKIEIFPGFWGRIPYLDLRIYINLAPKSTIAP